TINNFKYFSDPLVKNDLKDGLYKMNGNPRTGNLANSLRTSTNQEINNIFNSLKSSIRGEGIDDDW
ncbi:MAG: hypothetical protein MI865_03665, partial [Proteobacteria bacterium]|nr:hypothetical protein [Pseudomonadota bacterium]